MWLFDHNAILCLRASYFVPPSFPPSLPSVNQEMLVSTHQALFKVLEILWWWIWQSTCLNEDHPHLGETRYKTLYYIVLLGCSRHCVLRKYTGETPHSGGVYLCLLPSDFTVPPSKGQCIFHCLLNLSLALWFVFGNRMGLVIYFWKQNELETSLPVSSLSLKEPSMFLLAAVYLCHFASDTCPD